MRTGKAFLPLGLVLALGLALGACSNVPEQNVYLSDEMGPGTATFGRVLAGREVVIERSGEEDRKSNGLAVVAGVILGMAVAALTMSGEAAMMVAGAVGGIGGYAASESLDQTNGHEYIIQDEYEQLQTVVVAAGDAEMMPPGTPIAMIESSRGMVRLVKLDSLPEPIPSKPIIAPVPKIDPTDHWRNPDETPVAPTLPDHWADPDGPQKPDAEPLGKSLSKAAGPWPAAGGSGRV